MARPVATHTFSSMATDLQWRPAQLWTKTCYLNSNLQRRPQDKIKISPEKIKISPRKRVRLCTIKVTTVAGPNPSNNTVIVRPTPLTAAPNNVVHPTSAPPLHPVHGPTPMPPVLGKKYGDVYLPPVCQEFPTWAARIREANRRQRQVDAAKTGGPFLDSDEVGCVTTSLVDIWPREMW